MTLDGCEVIWNNLELKSATGKCLISGASGSLAPRTITAIMGPSGAGKSSLLDSLSGRIAPEMTLKGEIKVNGQERDPSTWPVLVSYVKQEFHCYQWQTLYETLFFVAKTKCKKCPNIKEKIENLINLLGLSSARDTYIAHMSGGEKVRVNIGIELLGDPSVILLDEPLSGLDSFNAINILTLLRKIATLNKTILITVHQPSYKVVEYFDSLILMSCGAIVYSGSFSGCSDFFKSCGYEVPQNAAPAEFFLDMLSLDTRSEKLKEESSFRIRKISKEWEAVKPFYQPKILKKVDAQSVANNGTKLIALIKRSLKNQARNMPFIKARLIQKVLIAIIFCTTFFKTGVVGADVFSFRGIIVFICQNEIFGVCNPIINVFIDEKKIIRRERMSGLYTGFAAYFTKLFTELIFFSMINIPYNIIIYLCIGFKLAFRPFFEFLLIMLFILYFALSWGFTLSIIAPNIQSAQAIGATINALFVMYSGAFSNPKSHDSMFKWLFWISPVHYGIRALIHNQLGDADNYTNVSPFRIKGKESIRDFGLDDFGVGYSLLALFSITFILQIIGSTVFHYKTNNNLKILQKGREAV